MDYTEFLESKRLTVPLSGIDVEDGAINSLLFHFQRDLVRWAARKGRAAIFADTGLGKTLMQLEWARLIGGRVLIVAPLTVARQTVGEGQKLELRVHYTRSGEDLSPGINITNYEMMAHFNPSDFTAVVLDESSILKALDGKTRAKLTAMFVDMPFKLCCTATPAPNDIAEIGNHAEFLGVMSRVDMLAAFFVHDDSGWRLKGHAEDPFYRWLASWGMSLTAPSDLGYEDDGFILPPLRVEPLWCADGYVPEGMLFPVGLRGIGERQKVRRLTMRERVEATAAQVNGDQWILWCGLNDEGRLLHRSIPGSVLVEGSQSIEEKRAAIEAFQAGEHQVLITKPKIAGFGMNFQNCHNMAFVGLSDSWESYYQCIRRCWRFRQEHPVQALIVLSEAERPIYDNVLSKEAEAQRMRGRLLENVREFERGELGQIEHEWVYEPQTAKGDDWTLMMGDSAERLRELESESIDLSVFSPPFLSLYTYTPTERDLGNSSSSAAFWQHFNYISRELLRVMRPGRNVCVHISQLPTTLTTHGVIGLHDLRGATISHFVEQGFVYHGEVCIDKDPQAQAIRTHSKGLLFVQLRKDASWLRPGLADYVLVFRKPGENGVAIHPDISNDDWIEWARPIWYGIRETDTLNVREGRENKDDRHIAPLQLGVIERCIRLWSNPGETVLSPFAGIGSEGYVAIQQRRRFVGIELKDSYFRTARRNLVRATQLQRGQMIMEGV